MVVRDTRRAETVYEVQEADAQNSDTSGDDARKQESDNKGGYVEMSFNNDDAVANFIATGIASINNALRRIEFLLYSDIFIKLEGDALKNFNKTYGNFREATPICDLYALGNEDKPESGKAEE